MGPALTQSKTEDARGGSPKLITTWGVPQHIGSKEAEVICNYSMGFGGSVPHRRESLEEKSKLGGRKNRQPR